MTIVERIFLNQVNEDVAQGITRSGTRPHRLHIERTVAQHAAGLFDLFVPDRKGGLAGGSADVVEVFVRVVTRRIRLGQVLAGEGGRPRGTPPPGPPRPILAIRKGVATGRAAGEPAPSRRTG